MKILGTIVFFLLTLFCTGQTVSDLIGKSYHDRNELKTIDALIQMDARVDLDRRIIRHFVDPTMSTHFLILEQEERINDSTHIYKIIDVVIINDFPYKGIIVIGSNEFKESTEEDTGFIVSLECCYDLSKTKWHRKSKKIIRAWTDDEDPNKLIEINPKSIYRIHEGFYRK
jgi:hypothetical protein